jgi:hypothetical protein
MKISLQNGSFSPHMNPLDKNVYLLWHLNAPGSKTYSSAPDCGVEELHSTHNSTVAKVVLIGSETPRPGS